jgi:aminoglycoside/choline kinase family phosphotransferase
LTHDGSGRLASVEGSSDELARVNRSLQGREFLDGIGWDNTRRSPLTGDASARAYETVTRTGEEPRILMNSPRLVLGPPVRDGRPYAEIAHTAQSITAFVAIARLLKLKGFAAPEIYAVDLDQGFALIENLGDRHFLDADGKPVLERYAAAALLLANMHTVKWPEWFEAAPGAVHAIPPFDHAAMQIEADLLLDWYLPAITGATVTDSQRREYALAWAQAFARLEGAEFGLMQRDFHSPNIIWRESRSGNDRLGLVDFQDALIGPLAYDLASLAMDARVTVSPELERQTVSAYVSARERDAGFSREKFEEAYAIMAAQRNAKILGIFVRLDRRDGKPAYLKHLPRIRDYLRRSLAHPSLSRLKAFAEESGVLAEHSL